MLDLRRPPGAPPLLIAHRGASALAPENTLAAFERARQDGADLVELDLRLSADGQVVVIHDGHLCRTTDGCGFVSRKKLAELKALDAGRWFDPRFAGERIPTLAEVLAWAREPSPPTPLMLEFKGGTNELKRGLVAKSVEQILAQEMAERVILIASHHPFLSRARTVAPAIATGTIVHLNWIDRGVLWLLGRWPALEGTGWARRRLLRPLRLSQRLGVNSLSIPAAALTTTLIQAAHEAGLVVSPGGAEWDYPTVIDGGADTISADDPAAVRTAYL